MAKGNTMSLFGALSEMIGGEVLAAALACDLALPAELVRERQRFIAWLADRNEARDIRTVVDAVGREIWVGAETRGLAQSDLETHVQAVAALIPDFPPSAALLAEIAAVARADTQVGAHGSEPIGRRIAIDMVSRAIADGATARAGLKDEVVLFLLDRTYAQLADEQKALIRFGPALGEFVAASQPEGTDAKPASRSGAGIASLGISPAFTQRLEQAGGAGCLADLGERYGIADRAVRRLVALIDGQALQNDARVARLEALAQWLGDVRAQLQRPSNDETEVRRLKALAATALADGDFEAAMDALRLVRRELREARRRTEERLREEAANLRSQMLEEARTTARLAELLAARGEHGQAAEMFGEAAMTLPLTDRETAWRLNLQRADALLAHGRERGDGAVITEALSAYGQLVRAAAETTNGRAMAEACIGHGDALMAAGEREAGSGRLKDAITIYQKAIQLVEREKDAAGLLRIRISLAQAMARLGDRDNSTALMRDAAQAFRDAATLIAPGRQHSDQIRVQMGLGGVLLALEEREGGEGGVALLTEAADCFRAALGVLDRETDGERWGEAQLNLGLALLGLGEQQADVPQLEGSVAAFRAGIDATPRVRAPQRWALLQMNLGNALAALGDRDASGTAQLDEAIAAYGLALEELVREADPLKWAITQMNLGTALIRLGERRDRRRNWLAAAGALVPALEVFEQQGNESLAEMTRHNLKRFQKSWESFLAAPGSAPTPKPEPAQEKRPRLAQAGYPNPQRRSYQASSRISRTSAAVRIGRGLICTGL